MDPHLEPEGTIFVIDLQNMFFCLLLFDGTFTSFFKKSKRSHKTVGIKVFLTILT
jgi:hypothetical protein